MINIIVNILSGKGTGKKNLKKVTKALDNKNIEYKVHITDSIGHAEALAKELSTDCTDTIIAMGGDGTFSEVLNGVCDPLITPVGFIPSGRGNDFAKSSSLHLEPLKALNDILSNDIINIDYFNVADRRCLNVAGTGLDVAVLERVAGKSGKIDYLFSLLYCINHFTPYKLKITSNGEETLHECIMAGVCNGGYIGGGMNISPLSNIADGKLNVMAIRLPDKGSITPVLMGFVNGKHIDKNYTTHFTCDSVSIEPTDTSYPIQIDGEISYDKTLNCSIVAGGLKTFKGTKLNKHQDMVISEEQHSKAKADFEQ